MMHVRNELVDVAGWPELEEDHLVQVLSSYAKARAIVWGSSALVLGLVLVA